jgi:hypothetical protein
LNGSKEEAGLGGDLLRGKLSDHMKSGAARAEWRWLWFSLSVSMAAMVLEPAFGRMFADSDVPYYFDIARGDKAPVLLGAFAAHVRHGVR